MGLFKRLIKNVFCDGESRVAPSSFENLSEQQIEDHMRIARYGGFVLTDAVRPAIDLQVVPRSGFRRDCYKDKDTGVEIPVVMAAASAETLFDLFLNLLDPLGDEVDVVLETSHDRRRKGHSDLYREHIDLPVLKSTLCEFEDLLMNDGCTGIAVLNPSIPLEVQFDEHKLFHVYAPNLKPFRRVLRAQGVPRRAVLPLISEAEHLHHTTAAFCDDFRQFAVRTGVGDFDRVFSDEL